MRLAIRSLGLAAGVAVALTGSLAAAEVSLVTGNDYPPYVDADLPEGGLSAAIVRAVYAHMGRDVTIDHMPWKRGYTETRHGTYAATFPYIPSPQRKQAFVYSEPIGLPRGRIMVTADSPIQAESVADLKGLTYCLPLGYTTVPAIERLNEAGELTRLSPETLRRCLKLLRAGRTGERGVAFIPIDKVVADFTARKTFGTTTPFRYLGFVTQRTTLHVIFPKSRDDPEQAAQRFNAALRELRESGAYDEVVNRFMQRLDAVTAHKAN